MPIIVVMTILLVIIGLAVYFGLKKTRMMGQKLLAEKAYEILKVLKQANGPMNVSQILTKLGDSELQVGLVMNSLKFLDQHGFISSVNRTTAISMAGDKTSYRITSKGVDYLTNPQKYLAA